MKSTHLSPWEQEEYLLAPDAAAEQHLLQCAACRAGVEQLQQGVALFRSSAVAWTAEVMTAPRFPAPAAARRVTPTLRWALAALLLLLALLPISHVLMRKPLSTARSVTAPALSDDALLQQVDEQVSEEVPDSMESLTHLVNTTATGKAEKAYTESANHVQSN